MQYRYFVGGKRTLYRKQPVFRELFLFFYDAALYCKRKVIRFSIAFENGKNWVVQRLLWRRGVLSRPITHVSLVAFSLSIVFIGIIFGKTGVFSRSSAQARQELVTKLQAPVDAQEGNVLAASVVPVTEKSEKPRDTILEHEVKPGETISQIAEKYQIDVASIRWANDLSDLDKVKPGQKLKILPVEGVAHTVASGDTIYSVAEKYKANPQAIADWPFNNIDETLKLQVGQVLIVPEGVPPTKPAPKREEPRYVAQGKVKEGKDTRSADQKKPQGPLGYIWPIAGRLTQRFTRYHTGFDIAGSTGDPISVAATGKVVTAVKERYGYGWHVVVDHGGGMSTLYAHMSQINVSPGQSIGQGQTVGFRGNTGRSTGPHLHFEVRKNGVPQNPGSYLK